MDEIARQKRQLEVEQLMAAEGLSWQEAWELTAGEDEASVWSKRWIRLARVAALGFGVTFLVGMFWSFTIVMQSHGTGRPVAEPAELRVMTVMLFITFLAIVVGLMGVLFTRSTRRAKVVAAVILVVPLVWLVSAYIYSW